MRKIVTLTVILAACIVSKTHAQVDPHFSQYYVYPMWLNPALTGTMETNWRVSAIYRNQWNNITNAFSTAGVSADINTEKNLCFGVNVMQQTAGNAGYKYFNAMGSISYTGVKFGNNGQHHISFALQFGALGRRFDPSKFQAGDQWVPVIGFNPTLPTADNLSRNSSTVFDVGTGISYFNASEENKVNVFGGISVAHLTQPEDPFIDANGKSKLPARYTFHAGARIFLSDVAYFVPNLLYMTQGNAQEKMVGGYFQLAAGAVNDVMLGVNYRFDDAVAPFAGFLFNNKFMVGLSYDVNTSTLGKLAKGSNAFELSITLLGDKRDNSNYFKCPRF